MVYHSASLHPSHPAEEVIVHYCDGNTTGSKPSPLESNVNLVKVHFFRGADLDPEDLPGVDRKTADLMRQMVKIGGTARQTVACLLARPERDGGVTCTMAASTEQYAPCRIKHDPELVSPPSEAECLEIEGRLNKGVRIRPAEVMRKLQRIGIGLNVDGAVARWYARMMEPCATSFQTDEEIPVEGYFVTRGLPPEMSEHIFHQRLSDDTIAELARAEIDELSGRNWERVFRAVPPGYQIVPLRPRVVPTLLLLRRRNGS